MPKKVSKKRMVSIVANWKMYKTIDEAIHFVETLPSLTGPMQDVQILLSVPFTALAPLSLIIEEKHLPFKIGAQNMHDATDGAFTGEIACRMLLDAGATFVILGHSERRRLFNESNAFINKKIKKALAEGLQPILCVGETDRERSSGEMKHVLETQIFESLQDVSKEEIVNLTIAYEPVWAIGTGDVATPVDAQEAHLFCRDLIKERWGKRIGDKIAILYGGSVKPDNAAALIEQPDVDGFLVGGASLDPAIFSEIINNVNQ